MQLPEEILNKIIELSYNINKKDIAQNFRKISDRYIGEKRGESLLNQDDEAIAYAIGRMPATYAAVNRVCESFFEILKVINDNKKIKLLNEENESNYVKNINENIENRYKTLLDVGAGTGAATLALAEAMKNNSIKIENVTCLEREDAMIKLGKSLFIESEIDEIKNASWIKYDINSYIKEENTTADFMENEYKADIVISSYMVNEFAESKALQVADKLWDMTNNILIIVDPGTPDDYKRLIKIKNYLYEKGGNILAPCTCDKGCGLPEADWCNFSCRVARTKIQKQTKGGEVPYEDEKFTYLIISKQKLDQNQELQQNQKSISRIIRHPIIRSNMVEVKLCSNGIINKTYTKKDKELYKKVKKAKVGDIIIE